MNRRNQKRITRELLATLKAHLDACLRNGKVPASWDGIELHQWVADIARERFTCDMSHSRKRSYNHARLTTPGL